MGRPWNGDYVFSSGDLVEDLTHNFFLETGARSGKLRVYETVEHPAARALTGYLLVRGSVHQVAYARALENLTGANLTKLFPSPRIPTEKIPDCKPAHQARRSSAHLPLLRERLSGDRRDLQRNASRDRGGPRGRRRAARRLPAERSALGAGSVRPDYAPEEIAEIAARLRKAAGLPERPSGEVANPPTSARKPAGRKTPPKKNKKK